MCNLPINPFSQISDEVFDKSFHVSVAIDGVTEEHKLKTILHRDNVHNRTRHLICVRKQCEEFIVLHLGFLEYAHYILTVNFYGLEAFHQRYNIHSLKFYFKTYNPEFTQIEIWFRFIFLLFTFIVTVGFFFVWEPLLTPILLILLFSVLVCAHFTQTFGTRLVDRTEMDVSFVAIAGVLQQ
jgi:hypothetical protein